MKREYYEETIDRKVPDNSPDGFHWETVNVSVASAGTKGGGFQGQWETCELCNNTEPRDEMGEIDGKWYCFTYDCFPGKMKELLKEYEE